MPYTTTGRREVLNSAISDYSTTLSDRPSHLVDSIFLILSSFCEDAKPSERFDWSDEAVALRDALSSLPDGPTVGDLTYAITLLLEAVVLRGEVRYSKLNRIVGILSTIRVLCSPVLCNCRDEEIDKIMECVGVLSCCEHEFFLRTASIFE